MTTIPLEYDFDTFVRGDENILAVSGALKALEHPGHRYNPLFIHGAPSVGKTHLLYALRRRYEKLRPTWNMLALPASEFIEECQQASDSGRMVEFRLSLWRLEVLMIDDVHLLAGKQAPMEELYHVYNRMLADSHQLILTSRYAPAELHDFPITLRSRFQSGLVVSLDSPRERLMRDIIVQKFVQIGFNPSQKAAAYLCKELRSVRELERLIQQFPPAAHANLKRISLQDVKGILENNILPRVTLGDIAKTVCKYFQVDLSVVRSAGRQHHLVQARQIAMYLARELTSSPLIEIGKYFGGRDHTTVIYANRKVEEELKNGSPSSRAVRDIRNLLSE